MEIDWDGVQHHTKIFDTFSIMEDKAVNEWGVVNTLLEELKIDSSSLESVAKCDDPPDCMLEFDCKLVGIEVVGLIDQEARELTIGAKRESEKSTEVRNWQFRAILAEHSAVWTSDTFHSAVRHWVSKKDKLVRTGILEKKTASRCDLFWLAIYTDEMFLTSERVLEFISGLKLDCVIFDRIYLVCSYEPGGNGGHYPCFRLK